MHRMSIVHCGMAMAALFVGCKEETGSNTRAPATDPGANVATTGLALEVGMDRAGNEYTSFDLDQSQPELCQKACADDARCKAFTYVRPGVQGDAARCWLKDVVHDPQRNDCCVSGVK